MEVPLPLWVAEAAPTVMTLLVAPFVFVWYLREKKAMARRAAERARRKGLTPAE